MANMVLTTSPSSSSSGLYEICQDTSNGNRIWCRVAGSERGCPAWTVGWKRQGYTYHTCKHVQQATRTLGLRLETRGDFQYVMSGFGGIATGTSGPAERTAIRTPLRPPLRTASAETRTARPAQTYVPSLEQVRKVSAPTQSNDLVRRGSRRRPDDE